MKSKFVVLLMGLFLALGPLPQAMATNTYNHYKSVPTGLNGFAVGDDGTETQIIDGSGNLTVGTVASTGAITGTSVTTTAAVKSYTSIFADGDTETSSVLLSSSTSLGTGNMSFSDVYKSIGNQNEGTDGGTRLHNGIGNGMITRFHILAGNASMVWTITPDTSLNINTFGLSVRGTELTAIYVNSITGWQPMGGTGTITIGYKSAAV